MKVKKLFGIISWLIFTLLVALVALYLILQANGYNINYKTLSVEKTGMIYLKSVPSDVKIYVNDNLEGDEVPFKMGNLNPGRYTVKVCKDNYVDWEKTLLVEQGKTAANENILLILKNPQELVANEEEKNSFPIIISQWLPKGLEIKNQSEIWFNDVFITRFSKEVKQVSWHTDLKHILVQLDNSLVIIDADGSNMVHLVDLSSQDTSQFIVVDSGKDLIYQDGKDIKKVRLQ